jgi:hypothetical protein
MPSHRDEANPLEPRKRLKGHGVAVGGDEAGLLRVRRRSDASRPAASSAIVIMKAANFRGLQDGSTASGGTFHEPIIACEDSGVSSGFRRVGRRDKSSSFIEIGGSEYKEHIVSVRFTISSNIQQNSV